MKYTPGKRKELVPVRFDSGTRDRLKAASRRIGGNVSTVIRLCVINKLPEIESGRVQLAKS